MLAKSAYLWLEVGLILSELGTPKARLCQAGRTFSLSLGIQTTVATSWRSSGIRKATKGAA